MIVVGGAKVGSSRPESREVESECNYQHDNTRIQIVEEEGLSPYRVKESLVRRYYYNMQSRREEERIGGEVSAIRGGPVA